MNLGELLQHLRGPMLNDRTSRVSGSSDYLWTDSELVTMINEAQRRLAVRSLLLRDGSDDDLTLVTLVEGQTEYVLHERVVAVVSAKLTTANVDLIRAGHSVFNRFRNTSSDTWVDPASFTNHPPGVTLAYSTDEELSAGDVTHSQITLRVHPAPAAAQAGTTIRLRVAKKPEDFDTTDPIDGTQPCVVPVEYQIPMLDWAAYMALRIVDDEAGNLRRAADFRDSFEKHVTEARNMVFQKMFSPMGWGFGKGGFSWGN